MKAIISNPLYKEGFRWRGQQCTVIKKTKTTVTVVGLTGSYGMECIFWIEEVTLLNASGL